MTRKLSIVFLLATLALGCKGAGPAKEPSKDPSGNPSEEPSAEVKLEKFVLEVPVTEDWIYDSKPYFTVEVENPNAVAVTADATVKIYTDIGSSLKQTLTLSEEIPARGSKTLVINATEDLDPGFYKASIVVGKRVARNYFFGVNPSQIVSEPDFQPDFEEFWAAAKKQLADIDMNAKTVKVAESGGQATYFVEMNSVPDGPDGDPVVVRGYWLTPTGGSKLPVIIHFFGYDSSPSHISLPWGDPAFCHFFLSTRGQMINNRKASQRSDGIEEDFKNIYGDWFGANFGNRDSYYYRGAFMDCVQAVRFMAEQPSSDMTHLFGEGSSQGGAFSYAAAALSDYPFTAIAPNVAFLGDFPDYFRIVSWPANTAKSKKGSMTDEQMYAFLSYFDTKNLATLIPGTCSVMASACLQDGTCPPHTNLAPFYNLGSTDKEIHFYPELQHDIPSEWPGMTMSYFKARCK